MGECVCCSAVLPRKHRRAALVTHPLGCHRPRISDRVCFRGILIRPVTGCSWVDVESILDHQVSDTTLRSRRDEWVEAGVFDTLADEAKSHPHRILGTRRPRSGLHVPRSRLAGGYRDLPGGTCADSGGYGPVSQSFRDTLNVV